MDNINVRQGGQMGVKMRDDPRPQEIYRHFKGGLYQIITLAKHSRTGERLVIYQALYEDFTVYARELAEFLSETDHEKYPSVLQKYRFERVEQHNMNLQSPDAEPNQKTKKTEGTEPKKKRTEERLHRDLQDKIQIVELRDMNKSKTAEKADAGRADTDTTAKKADAGRADTDTTAKKADAGRADTDTTAKKADAGQSDTTAEQQTDVEELQTEETINIDPLVMEFLDADSYEERLNILAALHCRITDDMINTMSVAVDVEVNEGDTEERYEALKNCLVTLEKYECNRLR